MVWINTLEPVLLQLGPLQIRWYGIMYALSFLVVYWYVLRQIKAKRFAMTEKQLDFSMLVFVGAMLVGARLVEVVYYNPLYYLAAPWKVFAIWQGGLSFHGGLVGIAVAAMYVSKKFGIRFRDIADVFIVPCSLAQAFGRFGNFTNHEVFGRITSSAFGVNFNGERNLLGELVYRHPSQLYEAAYDLVIFGILLWRARNRKSHDGSQFALFLLLYGVFRFVTEWFREPQFHILGLTPGQFLNLPMIVLGGYLLYRFTKKASVSGNAPATTQSDGPEHN